MTQEWRDMLPATPHSPRLNVEHIKASCVSVSGCWFARCRDVNIETGGVGDPVV